MLAELWLRKGMIWLLTASMVNPPFCPTWLEKASRRLDVEMKQAGQRSHHRRVPVNVLVFGGVLSSAGFSDRLVDGVRTVGGAFRCRSWLLCVRTHGHGGNRC